MKLFLDDIRSLEETYVYTNNKIYLEGDWIIVRNYSEFILFIDKNGLPEFISFDHDLGLLEYIKLVESGLSKRASRKEVNEKSGYDCAIWLVDYCIDNNLKLPLFVVHSMNPIGKEKINNLLDNFNKFEF